MDEISAIEFAHDTRETLIAAMTAVGDIEWKVIRRRYGNTAPPGWEPFTVENEFIYFRKPELVDE